MRETGVEIQVPKKRDGIMNRDGFAGVSIFVQQSWQEVSLSRRNVENDRTSRPLMPTPPLQRQREALGHARRPSQAYRHTRATVSPLAKYLQLAQTLGFWAALLFVFFYVLDVDTSISSHAAVLKRPLIPRSPKPSHVDPVSEKVLPDAEKVITDIPPAASLGAAVQTYSCFGKPCSAEEYEYIVTTFSGLNKSPLYQGLNITRVKQAPTNAMIESCIPPSRRLADAEDIPDVGVLPWLTNVHQYLAHESELCVVALRHDLSEGTFVGRLEPPTYLGDRVCQTFLASNNERERLEGWRCMDSDTTYSIVDVSDNSNIDKNSNLDLGSSRSPSAGEVAAEGHANGSGEEEVSHNRSLQDLDEVLYHAPLLAGIRNAFISPVGHVFSALHALVPNGYCQPERLRYARPALSKRLDGRVFVISQPRDTSDPYTTLIDALPRLATHYGELTSVGGKDIMIHHNGGAVMEQILGLLDIPKRRLVTGDIQFDMVYLPEPSPRCGVVSVYQTSLLRDILRARLIESAPGLRRKPAQGIVLIVQGGPDPSTDPRIANADVLASQLRELYPNEKVIVLRSNPGKEPRSAKDTLALFHLAKLVIAPRGPRLAFLLASARGTAVIEVVVDKSSRTTAPTTEDPSAPAGRRYADLARALDLQVYVMAGKFTNSYTASLAAPDVSKAGNIMSEGPVESGIVVDVDKVKAVLFEVSESQGRKP